MEKFVDVDEGVVKSIQQFMQYFIQHCWQSPSSSFASEATSAQRMIKNIRRATYKYELLI